MSSDQLRHDWTTVAPPNLVNCLHINMWGKWFSACPIYHALPKEWDHVVVYIYFFPRSSLDLTVWDPRALIHSALISPVHFHKPIVVIHLFHPTACDRLPPHLPDSTCHAISAIHLYNRTVSLIPPFICTPAMKSTLLNYSLHPKDEHNQFLVPFVADPQPLHSRSGMAERKKYQPWAVKEFISYGTSFVKHSTCSGRTIE